MLLFKKGSYKLVSCVFVTVRNTELTSTVLVLCLKIYSLYCVFIPIMTGILHCSKRAQIYHCKFDRDREREVRSQLSANARAFHFSGSSCADGEDADGDSLP